MNRILTFSLLAVGVMLLGIGTSQAVVCPATTDAEWEALVASSPQQATFIRTSQDWNEFKGGAQFMGHPLHALTAQQLADFAASLWIVDGGVVTMKIGILKDNLSSTNLSNVLAAFGISTVLATDHEDYWCESRANCKTMSTYMGMTPEMLKG